jgi:hypothetical protein
MLCGEAAAIGRGLPPVIARKINGPCGEVRFEEYKNWEAAETTALGRR